MLKTANRSGKRVNIHLRDGSVIVNVQVVSTRRRNTILQFQTPTGIKEVAVHDILDTTPILFPPPT
jgi:hypothetical protein